MAIFTLHTFSPPPDLEVRVAALYPNNFYPLAPPTVWVINAPGKTSKEVADSLGFVEGAQGRYFITAMAGYWGHYATDLWEWIKLRLTP